MAVKNTCFKTLITNMSSGTIKCPLCGNGFSEIKGQMVCGCKCSKCNGFLNPCRTNQYSTVHKCNCDSKCKSCSLPYPKLFIRNGHAPIQQPVIPYHTCNSIWIKNSSGTWKIIPSNSSCLHSIKVAQSLADAQEAKRLANAQEAQRLANAQAAQMLANAQAAQMLPVRYIFTTYPPMYW